METAEILSGFCDATDIFLSDVRIRRLRVLESLLTERARLIST